MNFAAGVLGILYGVVHGASSLMGSQRPQAETGSHQVGAIPGWAQFLWLALAFDTLAGSVAYLVSPTVGPAAMMMVGATAIWVLAIANGFWIHGRPTVSHHLVRGLILAVLLFLTFQGLN